MSDPQCFNDQFRLFVAENKDLVRIRALLTTVRVSPLTIPFPSCVFHQVRMKFIRQPVSEHEVRHALQYLPRQLLGQFIDAMATERLLSQKEIILCGYIGTGKSYLLAAYALYMLCSNRLQGGKATEKVVYISNCRVADESIVRALKFSLLLAFPDEGDAIQQLSPNHTLDASMYDFIDSKCFNGFKFLFLVDDWNFYRDQNTSNAVFLRSLFAFGRTVYGVSASRDDEMSAEVAPDATYVMPGLTDEEWMNCWKHRCEAFRQLKGADEAQLLFLTGRIPLFLQKLIDAEGDLRERMRKVEDDTSEGGGAWIAYNIELFYNVHVVGDTLKHHEVRQRDRAQYITAMISAIGQSPIQFEGQPLFPLFQINFFNMVQIESCALPAAS